MRGQVNAVLGSDRRREPRLAVQEIVGELPVLIGQGSPGTDIGTSGDITTPGFDGLIDEAHFSRQKRVTHDGDPHPDDPDHPVSAPADVVEPLQPHLVFPTPQLAAEGNAFLVSDERLVVIGANHDDHDIGGQGSHQFREVLLPVEEIGTGKSAGNPAESLEVDALGIPQEVLLQLLTQRDGKGISHDKQSNPWSRDGPKHQPSKSILLDSGWDGQCCQQQDSSHRRDELWVLEKHGKPILAQRKGARQ